MALLHVSDADAVNDADADADADTNADADSDDDAYADAYADTSGAKDEVKMPKEQKASPRAGN